MGRAAKPKAGKGGKQACCRNGKAVRTAKRLNGKRPKWMAQQSEVGAKHCTPDLTKMTTHWKTPLTIPVEIHWKSDDPLEHATEQVKIHWKMPLDSTMVSEVSISGVQYFALLR